MSQEAATEELGEIVVTGSRIPRANLTAPTAVTTIDAEVINQSGMINVADILRAVPSFGVSALSSANSNFLTTSSGVNTLQLRNLEEDRTLVLVNGRRYVSGLRARRPSTSTPSRPSSSSGSRSSPAAPRRSTARTRSRASSTSSCGTTSRA